MPAWLIVLIVLILAALAGKDEDTQEAVEDTQRAESVARQAEAQTNAIVADCRQRAADKHDCDAMEKARKTRVTRE